LNRRPLPTITLHYKIQRRPEADFAAGLLKRERIVHDLAYTEKHCSVSACALIAPQPGGVVPARWLHPIPIIWSALARLAADN
jgi:hypothetical protein